jgi:hypothetical protein
MASQRAVNASLPKFPLTPSFHSRKTFLRFAGFYSLPAHNGIVIETSIPANVRLACANTATSLLTHVAQTSTAILNQLRPLAIPLRPNSMNPGNLLRETG